LCKKCSASSRENLSRAQRRKSAASGEFVHAGVRLHLLETVNVKVSATDIRKAAAAGGNLKKYVSPGVAEYINKLGIYKRTRVNE